MTVSELSDVSCIKENTIRRNAHKVAGYEIGKDGEPVFPRGSRYPYNIRRNKLDTIGKRRLVLLDATYHYLYVDHDLLHMSLESFNTMVEELVCAGYLQSNGSGNCFGANQYDTTLVYERVRGHTSSYQASIIANDIATAAGHFCGAALKELVFQQ